MFTFVNLTPHDLNIKLSDGSLRTIKKSGKAARVAYERKLQCSIGGVDIYRTSYGGVYDLPDEVEGVLLIVSRMVKDSCEDRSDLLVPGELIRDKEGRVIGCEGLSV